jgi:two-component sensor histidine kinase
MSIPCGLIINELISNSLKYAFKDREKGKIILSLKVNGAELELVVQDNGVGVPKDMDIEQTDTLGLQLVSTLVEQIEGKITLDRTKGSKFVISFKSKNEE